MRAVMYDGTAVATCGEYLITVGPAPGRGAASCNGASCDFDCSDKAVWFYQRVLSATSPASLTIPKKDRCCDCVPRKWHDELSFHRWNPSTKQYDLKWIGPVVDVVDDTTGEGALTINAFDRSVWLLDESSIPAAVSNIDEAVELRFERLWKLANSLSPVLLDLIRVGGFNGINIDDEVSRWSALGPELQKLAAFGVNWTVIADKVKFGDLSSLLTSELVDPAVAWRDSGAIVSDIGSTSITNLIVKINNGEDFVIYPEGIDIDPCDGLHIRTVSPDFEMTRAVAEIYARREFERRASQGLAVQTSVDSSVSEDWPISICDMRPGGTVMIDTSNEVFCLKAETLATLYSMTVEGVGCKETNVKVSLAPESNVVADL